ncbi:hypothetical protein ASD15_21930 [Massilia sp. Root351]|jgi:hypothetical protein|uniref:hypothetical protein n=1 Tax=Massilia sp. Root351 TaxID=1736522 RepID=UPI00070AE054|nr:hypothetical protein [Massilia sp. Root351]KQV78475.1 hypothetical protein ASD15_21930 [Massilia sp. Root351]
MSVEEAVYAALCTVLANTHAVELPESPTWPALVFEVTSTPESGWVMGGGYDKNDITVTSLSKSKLQLTALRGQIFSALEGVDGFMGDDFAGDADYQGEANVYAYVQTFTVRTRR